MAHEVSTLATFLVNNHWWILMALMMIEVVIVEFMELGIYIHEDTMSGKKVSYLDNGKRHKSFRERYLANGRHPEMKVVMAAQCFLMGIWMYIESGRGLTQFFRDIGPKVNSWIWFTATITFISMALLPLMFERDWTKQWRVVLTGFLGFFITIDTMTLGTCELAGITGAAMFIWLSYWALDVWFWFSQFVILLIAEADFLINALFFAVYRGTVRIIDSVSHLLTRKADREREARRLRRDLVRAVEAIQSENVEFEVPYRVDKHGTKIIDIYDVLAGLEAQAYLEQQNVFETLETPLFPVTTVSENGSDDSATIIHFVPEERTVNR